MGTRPLTQEIIDQYTAAGLWSDEPLYRDVERHAEARPDAVAVGDQHERLSYREFIERTNRYARLLLDQGAGVGDVVAVQTPNRVVLPAMHLACNRIGAFYLPLSDAWRHREVGHLLRLSRARVMVAPPATGTFDFGAMVADLRPDLPDLAKVGLTEGTDDGVDFSLSDAPAVGERIARHRDPNVATFAMVSSGTTDLPKISPWTDNNLRALLRPFIERMRMGPDDLGIGIAPANTGATGYVFPLLAALLAGAGCLLQEHWNEKEAVDLLERESATFATAIPTQLIKILQVPDLESRDLSWLSRINNAGAPLPPERGREVEAVFGCTVQSVYGATDGGVPVMTAIDDPVEKRLLTVGQPLPATELRLVDATLRDVAPGEKGEIIWRNGTKTFGYLNEPERTEAAFIEGFYRSGDLGAVDRDGYLSIVGRVKDMIIRGGQNIAPVEIEALLAEHPAVSEIAVVGLPDDVYGERACACVVLKPGAGLGFEEMVSFLRDKQLATFKLPERLEFFDRLPESAGGKVSKVDLRELVVKRTQA